MAFRTWSGGGRRRVRRRTIVVGLVVLVVVTLATAALAWFPDAPEIQRPVDPPASTPTDTGAATGVDGAARDREPVWHCPVRGGRAEFRDDYGYRKPSGRVHRGVDLYALLGTPVVAPERGRIERSEGGTAGKQVTLHSGDRRYVFAHLSRFEAGGEVDAGETIGYVGDTGNARGSMPHLHVEIRDDGGTVDPYPLLDEHCR